MKYCRTMLFLYLTLLLSIWSVVVRAQESPAPNPQPLIPLVKEVDAIGMTVADMDRSVAFYKNVLFFEPVSDLEVWGTEYEQLQGVFGLRIRVVRMQLGDECIELTEYLAPHDGRPLPLDTRANDIMHWQTKLFTKDVALAAHRVRTGKFSFVSPGVVDTPGITLGFTKAVLVRDPDGHSMQLSEK